MATLDIRGAIVGETATAIKAPCLVATTVLFHAAALAIVLNPVQPEPKKPRLKMDATLSRFLVFGLAPGAISGSDRIHNAMSALVSKPRRTKGQRAGAGKRRW